MDIETHRQQFADALRARILPLRSQADIRNGWLKQRLETVLPEILEREGIDMWIVACREYNEDPVVMSLLPEPQMNARRRTVLVFNRRPDGSLERLTLSRYPLEGFYEADWDPEKEEQQAALARVVRERDPRVIGLNISADFAFGDGLSHHEHEWVTTALGPTYADRVQPAERVCVGWLERRITLELTIYPEIVGIGHEIIAEAFSPRAIRPGVTTTDDVAWWMRQTMHDAGLRPWFHPIIDIQAHGEPPTKGTSASIARRTILPGDVLHCDMGFMYLGLASDQQQMAYVLRPGETDAPAGLKAALAAGNRLQDIHNEHMAVGRTGNEVLRLTLEQARAEGITPHVYSHAIGYHGHAAGPLVGLWDQQDGVQGIGDYPLFDNTCYSVELNVWHPVPEWDNQPVQMALEEDAALINGEMVWLNGRQTKLHLI